MLTFAGLPLNTFSPALRNRATTACAILSRGPAHLPGWFLSQEDGAFPCPARLSKNETRLQFLMMRAAEAQISRYYQMVSSAWTCIWRSAVCFFIA